MLFNAQSFSRLRANPDKGCAKGQRGDAAKRKSYFRRHA